MSGLTTSPQFSSSQRASDAEMSWAGGTSALAARKLASTRAGARADQDPGPFSRSSRSGSRTNNSAPGS